MELISPMFFVYTFLTSPLTMQASPLPALTDRHAILALCFLAHYLNRALISPLRTPSRSKTHIIVPLSGIGFNVINGSLMGSYLSSPFARIWLQGPPRISFYVGLGIWAIGLIGNIYHDEILLNIRRKAKTKGKAKEGEARGEHYAIPQGGLYSLISYPNYFFEWVEWFGFALASSPLPFHLGGLTITTALSSLLYPQTYIDLVNTPAPSFFPSLSPPWIFLISEFLLMVPRAYKGHKWYLNKFGDSYPKNRKAVIPFVL
jgi:3-oxo-5-alpha-steroid 4-dehydrogenase 1